MPSRMPNWPIRATRLVDGTPWPVPVTLQSVAIAALAAAFGARIGVATVVLYLLEGAAGLPVFAGATAGIPYLLGPTGGFLLGILQSFASMNEVKNIFPGIDQIIIYLVAVVVLLARPRGLFGRKGVMET